MYNLLPFVEQEAVRKLGEGKSGSAFINDMRTLITTPIAMFNCPTRRSGLFPYTWIAGGYNYYSADDRGDTLTINEPDETMMARADYAACAGGDGLTIHSTPPPSNDTGVIFVASHIRLSDITRGTSNTFIIGERYINPVNYFTGQDGGDNEVMYVGFDNDTNRETSVLPMQDTPGVSDDQRFGSAHSGGCHMLMCDGSVHFINYNIRLNNWMPLGIGRPKSLPSRLIDLIDDIRHEQTWLRVV